MVQIEAATLYLLYLGATLAAILGLWISHSLKQQRKQVLPTPQLLCVCEYCKHSYLADRTKAVSRCPQCQAYNKENHYIPKKA